VLPLGERTSRLDEIYLRTVVYNHDLKQNNPPAMILAATSVHGSGRKRCNWRDQLRLQGVASRRYSMFATITLLPQLLVYGFAPYSIRTVSR